MPPLYTLSDVTVKRRGRRILGPVNLSIDAGGPTMVIGPNGSGKTSLLRVTYGIERISTGQVTTNGNGDTHAFVFQSPTVLRRTVAENLAYPLRVRGATDINAAVDRWLDRIGLTQQANRAATRLSGGERQKLAIARALICEPQVLFLDEPCANLDGHTTREIEALLATTAHAGTKLIMSTHDMGQARRLADNVIFLLNGAVHETGSATVLSAPTKTPELAAFLKGDIVT